MSGSAHRAGGNLAEGSIKYNERNLNVYLGKVCPQMYTMKTRGNEPTFSKNERQCAATFFYHIWRGRNGLVVNTSDSGSRGRGFETHSGRHVVSLSKTYLPPPPPPPPPPQVLVILRKRWFRPNMTEKLFSGTLSIKLNQTKTIYGCGDYLGHVTQMPHKNLCSPYPRRLHIKFGFDWPSSLGEDV